MPLRQRASNGESEARTSVEPAHVVAAPKAVEDPLVIGGRNADARIANRDTDLLVIFGARNVDRPTRLRITDRVSHQVCEDAIELVRGTVNIDGTATPDRQL